MLLVVVLVLAQEVIDYDDVSRDQRGRDDGSDDVSSHNFCSGYYL